MHPKFYYVDPPLGSLDSPYSTIHKATCSLVTSHSLQNGKMSMGSCHTEQSPEAVLYGGRQPGSFVNSAVSGCFLLFASKFWEVVGTYGSSFCSKMNAA